MSVDIGFDHGLEFLGNPIALQRDGFDAVLVDGSNGVFPRAGQADTDIRVFAFAWSVDDATHHGHLHVFDTVVRSLPLRHFVTDVALNVLGQLLEVGACRAATARTGGDQGQE